MAGKLDLTGQVFGELTAIRPTSERSKGGSVVWECLCSCGKVCKVDASSLRIMGVQSCGHKMTLDIKGHRFGRLTAIRQTNGRKNGNAQWVCYCDCGNSVIVSHAEMRFFGVFSCGCITRKIIEGDTIKAVATCPSCGMGFMIDLNGEQTPQFCRVCSQRYSGQTWHVCPICRKLYRPAWPGVVICGAETCRVAWEELTHDSDARKGRHSKLRRVCKSCGVEFDGSGEQRLCPDCRKAAQNTVVRPRECKTCGRTFDGGPRAWYCPDCRKERTKSAQRESKRRKEDGKTRTLGSVDLCEICGKEYVVTGGLQRYCPDCAPETVRGKVLPHKRGYAAQRAEKTEFRKEELRENSALCAYCGKTYTPHGASVTCSDECAREWARLKQGMADYRRGRRKMPGYERYSSGLPQSSVPGVTYHRQTGKWQVTHDGEYIGIFESQEEAENKKKELNED